jgi:hypothetical protein
MSINALLGATSGSTWLDHFLTSGRGNMHLYHVVFFYLAAAIVFPDKIVAGISERINRHPGWRSLILLELSSLVLMIAMTLHFRVIDPRFSSWEPVLMVSFWLVFRITCHAFDLE